MKSALSKLGVFGLNHRNITCIAQYNERKYYPLADNKIQTKKLAQECDIQVPELYRTIQFTGELRGLENLLAPLDSFVAKPAHGSGGDGVLVVERGPDSCLYSSSGKLIKTPELKIHLANTLHGLYSLGGRPDQVIIEERVQFDPVFEGLTVRGVPDIRIIVFLGVPIIAMVRLPTISSAGRANLHQGAVGVGVNMKTGLTTYGVRGSKEVTQHPDTRKELAGLELPNFSELLSISSRCYDFSHLGYLGVDLVYDKHKGPMLLEINARPGLAVQIANKLGLQNRIDAIRNLPSIPSSIEERLELVKSLPEA